jgi:hypothetical protein
MPAILELILRGRFIGGATRRRGILNMSSTKSVAKVFVVSLVLVFVLSAVYLPTTSASYGDVRRFLRPGPFGLGPAKISDVYMDAAWDPPGRVCSYFTVGIPWGLNWINYLDSNEDLIIGVIGFSVEPPDACDTKSAREFYDNFRYYVLIDDEELPMEKTPLRPCTFVDPETGEKYRWWDWRYGATFKSGELAELLGGLGTYTIRFKWYLGETLLYDSNVDGVYQFELVESI